MPPEFLRGGFKYLTLALQTPGSVELTDLKLNYTAMPHFNNMRAYTGYFHSNDELLNRCEFIYFTGCNGNTEVHPEYGMQAHTRISSAQSPRPKEMRSFSLALHLQARARPLQASHSSILPSRMVQALLSMAQNVTDSSGPVTT